MAWLSFVHVFIYLLPEQGLAGDATELWDHVVARLGKIRDNLGVFWIE